MSVTCLLVLLLVEAVLYAAHRRERERHRMGRLSIESAAYEAARSSYRWR
jgi:hypothetical protein